MEWEQKVDSRIRRCKNIFDVAACCFDQIKKLVNNETYFMAAYFDFPVETKEKANGKRKKNPNSRRLKGIISEIVEILFSHPTEADFPIVLEKVRDIIRSVKMEYYLDENYGKAGTLFAILMGIDTYVDSERKGGRYGLLRKGPLNTPGISGRSAVYLANIPSMSDQEAARMRYRKKSVSSKISDIMKSLLFLEERSWFPGLKYPSVKPLYIFSVGRQGILETVERKILHVAVFPYPQNKRFEFDMREGSSFGVSYDNSHESEQIKDIYAMMDMAVEANANFIMFPEFTVSPALLMAIKEYLHKNEDRLYQRALLAVYAGSSWEEPGNNVLHILDYTGMELGTYHKYSPFTEEDIESGNVFKMCEALMEPGKSCTILDVEGVGRVLPAICRDIINGEYTEKLVRTFLPFLVLAPAYSPSVASFQPHLEEYIKKYHTCSVLCNCCAAVKKDQKRLGLAEIVQKQKSSMIPLCQPIDRMANCFTECKPRYCGSMICFDFSAPKADQERDKARQCTISVKDICGK